MSGPGSAATPIGSLHSAAVLTSRVVKRFTFEAAHQLPNHDGAWGKRGS